jgi:hypothetical protein
MRRLTTRELLYLQDMCLDAEFRCHERAVTAHIKGDSATTARELGLKEQYCNLKKAILDDLYSRGNHDPLDATLLRLRTTVREDGSAACNDSDFSTQAEPIERTA